MEANSEICHSGCQLQYLPSRLQETEFLSQVVLFTRDSALRGQWWHFWGKREVLHALFTNKSLFFYKSR